MSKLPPPADFDDNPEWTDEDFARARPANEVHCSDGAAKVGKHGRRVVAKANTRKA
jgi:hypothetical protein